MPRMPGPKRDHPLGDGPIQEEYRRKMIAIMETLDDVFNPGMRAPNKETGIVVMVFPYGDKTGRCNFISNGADRNDVVALMKEMIGRFEGQPLGEEGHA